MSLAKNIYEGNKFRAEYKNYGVKEGTLCYPIKRIEDMDLDEFKGYLTFFNGIGCDNELYNKVKYSDSCKIGKELQKKLESFIEPEILRLHKMIYHEDISFVIFDLYRKYNLYLARIELILELVSLKGKESEVGLDRIIELVTTKVDAEYGGTACSTEELELKNSILDKIVIKQ